MALGINPGDTEPRGAAVSHEALASLQKPPGSQGPARLPGPWCLSSVSPGEHPGLQEPWSFSGGTAPLLRPAPRHWGQGPRFGAWPRFSGQPRRAPGAPVLVPRFVPLLRGCVAPSLRCGRPTSIAGRRCARPGIGTGERVSAGGQPGVWGCRAAGCGLGQQDRHSAVGAEPGDPPPAPGRSVAPRGTERHRGAPSGTAAATTAAPPRAWVRARLGGHTVTVGTPGWRGTAEAVSTRGHGRFAPRPRGVGLAARPRRARCAAALCRTPQAPGS